MAFNKAEPQDTTKIRNLGVVIRPNWVAIEEADSSFRPYALNLQNRTPLVVANNPATIAGTSIGYVKNDSAGNPEAYLKDGSGNIVQMTVGGRIGGPTTNYTINTFRFKATTFDYGRNNITNAMLSWNAAGTGLTLFDATIVKVSTGFYRVTMTTARATANYWPMVTLQGTGTEVRVPKINIESSSQFTITIVNESASLRDNAGYCVVVGGF
jgi:hypothetical protein